MRRSVASSPERPESGGSGRCPCPCPSPERRLSESLHLQVQVLIQRSTPARSPCFITLLPTVAKVLAKERTFAQGFWCAKQSLVHGSTTRPRGDENGVWCRCARAIKVVILIGIQGPRES